MNIDDVVIKAKQAANTAAQKTEKVVNLSKLKLECAKTHGEINTAYEKLGRSFYQMRKGGYQNDELIDSLSNQLDTLHEREKVLKQEISALRNVLTCSVCSHANPKESLYCGQCGAKLHEPCCPTPPNDPSTTEPAAQNG